MRVGFFFTTTAGTSFCCRLRAARFAFLSALAAAYHFFFKKNNKLKICLQYNICNYLCDLKFHLLLNPFLDEKLGIGVQLQCFGLIGKVVVEYVQLWRWSTCLVVDLFQLVWHAKKKNNVSTHRILEKSAKINIFIIY
jgi:hypothetical protein